jgi:ribose transport system ATP-binding protein
MSSELSSEPAATAGGVGALGRVDIVGASKSYPGVQALQDVSLTLRPATVTALAGENGAGKSTFIKLLSGAEVPDAGRIELDGEQLPATPGAVIDAGVSVIYQELTDIPDMSVFENILLARLPSRLGVIRRRKARAEAKAALGRVGLGYLNIDQPMRNLSMAQRQLVEIARCLTRKAKVLVFDEPTSSLPEKDVRGLLAIIKTLREQGVTIVYVSHHLDELFEIGDYIAVLRDGRLVADAPVGEWTEDGLVRSMLAKDLEHAYPWRDRNVGDVRLNVKNLVAAGVSGANIQVRSGEIVGLVGLAGAGRTELLKAIAGASPRSAGSVTVDGKPIPGSTHGAAKAGVVYAPEDRKREGLVIEGSVEDNIGYGLYSHFSRLGWISGQRKARLADESIAKFGVKTSDRRQLVGGLSGGNQQKVVLARVAGAEPLVVLLDDPTRGVDVGAKAGIHEHVLALAERGAAVVLTSSDTDEVLAVADRIYVLRAGRIVGEVTRAEFDRERALHLAAAG